MGFEETTIKSSQQQRYLISQFFGGHAISAAVRKLNDPI